MLQASDHQVLEGFTVRYFTVKKPYLQTLQKQVPALAHALLFNCEKRPNFDDYETHLFSIGTPGSNGCSC